MDRTPASLLERLRRPDERQAWDRFVELYSPLIYFWACRLGLQAQDAADLAQDVFTTLLQKLPDFHYDPRRSFRAWLRTVTWNTWRAKQRRAAQPRCASASQLTDLECPDSADAFAEAEYSRHLTARALELMRAQFEPATWQAFWACVVEDRAVAEVARELGMTPNAVYIAKSRVLTLLRQELKGLLD
jgi:RNA polymerase sigma-70 factor (ECF subfamily)